MLKTTKKVVAAVLAVAMMAGITACKSDKSWAMKNDSLTAPIGVYIYNLYNAYQSAQTMVTDTSKPLLEQKIDGKDANTYIKEKALDATKSLFVMNDKMKELGLSLTADETKSISSNTDTQWAQASSTLEKYGISKASFNLAYSDYYTKYQKVFTALYGKGGKKEVPEADLKAYFEKNYTDFSYFLKPLYSSDASGSTVMITKAEQAALEKEFNNYAADIKAGKMTMQQAADAFKTSSKQTTEQLQSGTEILDSASGFPDDFISLLSSMKAGEVKAAEISGTYLVVMKNDITKKTTEQLGSESTRNAILAQMKGKEYSDELDKEAAAYTKITLNQQAIDSYKPSMFETKTSSAAAVSSAAAASAASTAESTASSK
ncbi:peptidylprolyl isomerase [Caproiciproducens faecalis]|uniref:Peptidyl-prolyl cis-trans isomerase n=1 Tax=Caproiciproducens faecalis TaxID=2820301 RepID=A0ABS7DNX8_9FIRM|nr:peptidylprolyl isomerase [Caproiciproducens faecalis]MBW7572796.1 peptidyl-prolyl cis-trans isomerase [Caproiciproducens faecalis]